RCLCDVCVFSSYVRVFFFFQAEDGIRDDLVTGVQTCALPISRMVIEARAIGRVLADLPAGLITEVLVVDNHSSDGTAEIAARMRSEERRVGKEGTSRGGPRQQ